MAVCTGETSVYMDTWSPDLAKGHVKCIKKQGGTMNLFHTGRVVLDKNAYSVILKDIS